MHFLMTLSQRTSQINRNMQAASAYLAFYIYLPSFFCILIKYLKLFKYNFFFKLFNSNLFFENS